VESLKLVISALGAISATLSGIWWIKAARVKVLGQGNEGVGFGGTPVNVRNEKGEIINFLATYALQSKWNSRAASASAVSAILGAFLFLMSLLHAH